MSDLTSHGFVSHEMPPDPFVIQPVQWAALPEAARDAELLELADWVEWLVIRYGLDPRTVPDCWAEHGALTEELAALRTAWAYSFSAEARGDTPLIWHAGFEHGLARLANWVARSGCRPGQHRFSPSSDDL